VSLGAELGAGGAEALPDPGGGGVAVGEPGEGLLELQRHRFDPARAADPEPLQYAREPLR
jgi:hypothetical protein